MRFFVLLLVMLGPAEASTLRIDFTGRVTSGGVTLTDAGGVETQFPVGEGTPLTGTILVDRSIGPAPVGSIFDSGIGPLPQTDMSGATPVDWLRASVSFAMPGLPVQDPPFATNTDPLALPVTQPGTMLEPFALQHIVFTFVPDGVSCCDTVLLTESTGHLLVFDDRQVSYSTTVALILSSLTNFLAGPGVPESFAMSNGTTAGFFSHSRTTNFPNGDRLRLDARVDFAIDTATATTIPEPGTVAGGMVGLGMVVLAVRRRRRRSTV